MHPLDNGKYLSLSSLCGFPAKRGIINASPRSCGKLSDTHRALVTERFKITANYFSILNPEVTAVLALSLAIHLALSASYPVPKVQQ